MRLSWTTLATGIYFVLAIAYQGLAVLIVPAYCAVLIAPYVVAGSRRWSKYRQGHDRRPRARF
jgi:hypothetical protein